MIDSTDYVIAIQVRNGSSRLPGKMVREFHGGLTIPELIIERLLRRFPPARIILATSTAADDAAYESVAAIYGLRCYRGSEQDVLGRVVEATQDDVAKWVVRVCGDNPFLLEDSIVDLLDVCEQRPCDYASFALPDGTPTILSHLGLFAEVIRKSVLARLHETATSQRHREHLTCHILDHPECYERLLLDVPPKIAATESLRLTVDTPLDFEVCQRLYDLTASAHGKDFTIDEVLHTVRQHADFQTAMAQEIAANLKQ